MNLVSIRVRRANVDDLEPLRGLWKLSQLDPDELEKRLTEFQVAEDEEGRLVGALGMHIEEGQGRLHSEVYSRAEAADKVRPLLWERLQLVARNHGLTRVWTQAREGFWRQDPFHEASAEVQQRMPAGFGERPAVWWVVQLREEVPPAISVEREFELFMQQQTESTARVLRQGRWLKWLATLLALGLLALVVGGGAYVLFHLSRPGLR